MGKRKLGDSKKPTPSTSSSTSTSSGKKSKSKDDSDTDKNSSDNKNKGRILTLKSLNKDHHPIEFLYSNPDHMVLPLAVPAMITSIDTTKSGNNSVMIATFIDMRARMRSWLQRVIGTEFSKIPWYMNPLNRDYSHLNGRSNSNSTSSYSAAASAATLTTDDNTDDEDLNSFGTNVPASELLTRAIMATECVSTLTEVLSKLEEYFIDRDDENGDNNNNTKKKSSKQESEKERSLRRTILESDKVFARMNLDKNDIDSLLSAPNADTNYISPENLIWCSAYTRNAIKHNYWLIENALCQYNMFVLLLQKAFMYSHLDNNTNKDYLFTNQSMYQHKGDSDNEDFFQPARHSSSNNNSSSSSNNGSSYHIDLKTYEEECKRRFKFSYIRACMELHNKIKIDWDTKYFSDLAENGMIPPERVMFGAISNVLRVMKVGFSLFNTNLPMLLDASTDDQSFNDLKDFMCPRVVKLANNKPAARNLTDDNLGVYNQVSLSKRNKRLKSLRKNNPKQQRQHDRIAKLIISDPIFTEIDKQILDTKKRLKNMAKLRDRSSNESRSGSGGSNNEDGITIDYDSDDNSSDYYDDGGSDYISDEDDVSVIGEDHEPYILDSDKSEGSDSEYDHSSEESSENDNSDDGNDEKEGVDGGGDNSLNEKPFVDVEISAVNQYESIPNFLLEILLVLSDGIRYSESLFNEAFIISTIDGDLVDNRSLNKQQQQQQQQTDHCTKSSPLTNSHQGDENLINTHNNNNNYDNLFESSGSHIVNKLKEPHLMKKTVKSYWLMQLSLFISQSNYIFRLIYDLIAYKYSRNESERLLIYTRIDSNIKRDPMFFKFLFDYPNVYDSIASSEVLRERINEGGLVNYRSKEEEELGTEKAGGGSGVSSYLFNKTRSLFGYLVQPKTIGNSGSSSYSAAPHSGVNSTHNINNIAIMHRLNRISDHRLRICRYYYYNSSSSYLKNNGVNRQQYSYLFSGRENVVPEHEYLNKSTALPSEIYDVDLAFKVWNTNLFARYPVPVISALQYILRNVKAHGVITGYRKLNQRTDVPPIPHESFITIKLSAYLEFKRALMLKRTTPRSTKDNTTTAASTHEVDAPTTTNSSPSHYEPSSKSIAFVSKLFKLYILQQQQEKR